ncbi:Transposon Tf2-6 polyprotein [Nosema granulosis]|uniref:Transposon Tf2-6 polyprotein n=1 Tax=Nosema granulosis TaxID=83296 RepID=A0A9P6GYT6_9MICR|nr:Transposon Tf2-6 polyprotein [Nosema granulosis]
MNFRQHQTPDNARRTPDSRPSRSHGNFVNKKLITKNMLETYFMYGYVILSSNDKNPEKKNERKDNEEFNKKTVKFKLIIEGLEEELYQEIRVIEDIRHIDIIKWCKDFEDLLGLNKWNKQIQLAVLRQIVKDEEILKDGLKDNWKDIKEQLIQKVFPPEEERLYKKKLFNIQQTEYISIKDYYDAIKENIKILKTMTKMKDNDAKSLEIEAFYNGLGKYTYGRIIEQEFQGSDDVFEYLKGIELKVKARSAEMKESPSTNHFGKTHNNMRTQYQNNVRQGQKYCKLHKECSHTTEECRTYDKDYYKKNNDSKAQEHNYLIKETTNNPTKTAICGRINNKKVELRLDCGASKSFIKNDTVKELGLQLREVETITTVFGNGKTERINHAVEVDISLKGFDRPVKEELYVLDSLPEDILLGNEFLFNNELVLDYKHRVIIMDKKIIPMKGNDEKYIDEIDEILYERLLIIDQEAEIADTELETQLKEYINDNEDFSKMKIPPIELFVDDKIKDFKLTPQYYSVPIKYEKGAKEEIRRLLKADIIEESRVPYASPSFLIEKKNKELRLVVDYRKINQFIVDEISLIPKIFENLYKIGKNTVFSKIDMKNGFNQLSLSENSRDLTSFTIFGQQYRYKRVPFGIKSGPKLFQRTVNKILEGIENCMIYIDDIIIYGKDKEEHNEVLKKVLKALKKYEVKINFEKSKFMTPKLEILGNIIEDGIIKVDTEAIDRLINGDFKTESKKDIQKIIGIITWYRNFLPDVSRRMSCITKLLRNDCTEKWGEEQTKALDDIKMDIKHKAQLKLPDFRKVFKLQCDASDIGMGAVLYQEHGVISYYSKKFNAIEQNYSIVEKEMFAIMKSLDFFRTLIQGFTIQIETDSRNCIFENKVISKRTERWKLILNEFDVTLKNIAGNDNNIADKLSRCYFIETKKTTELFKQVKDCLVLRDEKPVSNSEGRYIIKADRRKDLIRRIHNFSIHAGMTSIYNSIKKIFEVKNIKQTIEEVIKTCEKCIRNKRQTRRKENNYKIMSRELMGTICSDIFGPFEIAEYDESLQSVKEKGFFITITDVYSRFTKVKFLEKITAKDIIEVFKQWIKTYGEAKTVITDNGKQYASKEFKSFLSRQGINRIATPMYHPASNGISERLNQTVAEVMRMYRGENIYEIERLIMKRLNYNYHRGIDEQPIAILTGHSRFDLYEKTSEHKPKPEFVNVRNAVYREIKKPMKGNKVFIKNFGRGKLDDLYVGPYEVIEVGERYLWYKVEGISEWIHYDHIKLFFY